MASTSEELLTDCDVEGTLTFIDWGHSLIKYASIKGRRVETKGHELV